MNFPQTRKITKITKSTGANRLVMATTRAATFSAKIRTLSEFHTRILSSQQPSNAEIVTTLRYFQQTLIGFLKDIPPENSALFETFNGDLQRANFFPNLSYSGLFYGIVNLLDAFPYLAGGQTAIAEAILDTLKALYFFLERDCVEQMAYVLASQLGVLPDELDKKLVRLLCECILPYSLALTAPSIPAVLMLVLQHSQDASLHTMIVECLMARREEVYYDLLAVIAKGTSESRIPAANLLFRYWPLMNPSILHRKSIQYRVQAWSMPQCQNTMCTEKAPSIRRCYDPVACARYGDTAPPMAVCKSCVQCIETDRPMSHICQPIPATNPTVCQNKGCESSNRIAYGTCFAEDCIRSHNHAPLRLCYECFTSLHNESPADVHVRHRGASCAWGTPAERDTVEAVVKLLKETSCQLEGGELEGKRPKWLRQLESGQAIGKDIDALSDERRMLSRFGVWIMAALCPSTPEAPTQSVGYIMSMVFQWFSTTALLPNDSMGAAIEQLKTDFTLNWLNMAIVNHYETFISILQPDLPEYAQVGGVWDKLSSRKDQMKEGLSKLLSLMPYDVITLDTWNRVIPNWLQALSQEVDEDDLQEIKILLCKIFEPDMCPLPFEPNQVFHFLLVRLHSGMLDEVLHALDWLHLLSRLNIRIPLVMLLEMFGECLRRLHAVPYEERNENVDDVLEPEGIGPLAAEVVMVDIIAQQISLNEVRPHEATPLIVEQIFSTCALLLQYSEAVCREHTCQNPETDQFSDCVPCQQANFLYQVIMHLSEQMCPHDEMKIGVDMTAENMNEWLVETQLSDSATTETASNYVISPQNAVDGGGDNITIAATSFGQQQQSENGVERDEAAAHAKNAIELKLATVVAAETSPPHEDEFVGVLPSERVETVQALSTTLTETDIGHHETCQVVTSNVCESQKGTPATPKAIIGDGGGGGVGKIAPTFVSTANTLSKMPAAGEPPTTSNCEFWNTSVGRFRFRIDQLPAELQLVHSLLMNVDRELDPDVQYFLLATLKYLCLHCEALSNARREHRGFLIWTQEKCLIPKLWTLLRSDYSHVGERVVPLLIHAITLPCGEEVFWNTVNADFTSEKWEVRFKAVEHAYILAHLLIPGPIKANRLLQTCLSCVFSHLIVSTHDPNMAVAQRTILALKALPQLSLNLMCICLEAQFDSCILDRPLIISRICLLATVIPEANILTWDFFIQRFETLALEAQLKSHLSDDSFVQDLLHTNPMSELYQRKVTKARQSLNEVDSVRSIVKSLRDNSLKHQLTIGARSERAEVRRAQTAAKVRGRRGATCDTNIARLRLRKVLMMVRVVRRFRNITDRITFFSPMRRSPRATNAPVTLDDLVKLAGRMNPGEDDNNAAKDEASLRSHHRHSAQPQFILSNVAAVGANVMSEAATIAAAAAVVGGVAAGAAGRGHDTARQSIEAYDHGQSWLSSSQRGSTSINMHLGGGTTNSGYTRIREFMDEESNLCLLLNRVVDMENPERHTVYMTVALFVHFLCKQKSTVGAVDEKVNAKKQSLLLRHFNALLGYSNSEKCLTIPPNRLRRAAVCNAFLSGLPEILDTNLMIGNQMLPIIVQLLLHLPSPQKFASDFSVADYSLNLLQQQSRHSWLHALIIILYKYRCDTPPINDTIRKLVLIVIATIENQCHVCEEHRCQVEFEFWSSESSDDGCGVDSDGEAIEEEDLEAVLTPPPTRPESLQIATSDPSASSKSERKSEIKFIQPEIIEPPKAKEGIAQKRRARRRHRSKHSNRLGVPSRSAAGDNPTPVAKSLFCGMCGSRLETFDEETQSLALVALSTFIHREPVMAAPVLFRLIKAVVRFVDTPQYSWHDNNVFVPGNSRSTAKQLIRVIFHQLSGSGIAFQIFDSHIPNVATFWPTIAFALADFGELTPVALLQYLFEDINKNWPAKLARILHNCAAYVPTIPSDAYLNQWGTVITLLEAFFRHYHTQLLLDVAQNASNSNNNNNLTSSSLNNIGGMTTFISSSNNLSGLAAAASNIGIASTNNNNNNGGVAINQQQQQQQLMQQQLQQQNQKTTFGNQCPPSVTDGRRGAAPRGPILTELKSAMIVMTSVLRVHNFAQYKSSCALVENYTKWVCEALHHCAVDLRDLLTVCTECNRALVRERDKQCITRAVCAELVQAIKFKCELVERNYMTIVEFILQDFGEDVPSLATTGAGDNANIDAFASVDDVSLYNTGASEAIRPFMSEILEFIADFHVLSKLKKQTNSDRIGGDLKAALSKVVALEMSRPTVRDSRTVMRFIPWLYSPPSLTQAVPGAFLESVTYVRILSWLLLGALHATKVGCLPIPIGCSNHMADYIHFVLVGFADQSKFLLARFSSLPMESTDRQANGKQSLKWMQSVVHMSALFYAFHLCQLWTIYCEQTHSNSIEDAYGKAMENVLNFWARVTPAILQLLSHSKVLAYMVNLHFVNTMQALQQCNSAVLCHLYPMWQPILTAYHTQIPTQLRVKLDACENQPPLQSQPLETWLKKVRYKISQIELQTSAASPFYNV